MKPKGDPRDRFLYPAFTLVIDSYITPVCIISNSDHELSEYATKVEGEDPEELPREANKRSRD